MRMSSVKTLGSALRGAVAALCLALLLAHPAFGATATITPAFTVNVTTNYPLPIPFQPTVATTFNAWDSSPLPYATGTFTVGTTGAYTATATSSPNADNALYLLTGAFSPNAISIPTTPLSAFFEGTQSAATTTLSNVTLTAGTQYSYLLVTPPGTGAFTFTLTGPGSISLGSVPNTPIDPLATVFVMIAALGLLMLLKMRVSAA